MTPHALIAPARLAGLPLLRTQSDERLVDLVRAGNDAAFEAIVIRYRGPLLRHCARVLPEARAEDPVQQAFVSAHRSLRASDGEMALKPWLYRIAHNAALNALRDRGLGHEQLSEEIDGVERPEQALERQEGLREVVAAVGALPERQRDAIVRRELEGRSYDEIARELGVSDGSVRQLLNRARNALRAGMTAVTPFGLLERTPWMGAAGGEAVSARVAEMCGAGAGAAVLGKVCATALVTGAVVGGVAGAPGGGLDQGDAASNGRPPSAGAAAPSGGAGVGSQGGGSSRANEREHAGGEAEPRRDRRRRHRGAGDEGDHDGGRGRRGGGDAPGRGDGDEAGEGSGRGGDGGRRGSGSGSGWSGSSESGSGGSGSGSRGSGSSGPGPGGTGSGSSGSGSGSGSSGSGTSGSGSGGSGTSGSSGSGVSGSGSGGSGSGSGGFGGSGSGSGGSGSGPGGSVESGSGSGGSGSGG